MAAEAQRLIAVSLGKIASARTRRTGVDLHKNLLVSTVLHKAKNVFIMESYKASVQARKDATVSTISNNTTSTGDKTDHSTNHERLTTSSNPSVRGDSSSVPEAMDANVSSREDNFLDNKENDPPICGEKDNTDVSMDSGENLKDRTTNSDRNVLGSCDVLEKRDINKHVDVTSSLSCGSCAKRRHSDDESDCSATKKVKSERSPCRNETQISSLVSIFNSGFSGLVNQQSATKGQGIVDSAGSSSCGTAVVSGFDRIARPILAMAMTV